LLTRFVVALAFLTLIAQTSQVAAKPRGDKCADQNAVCRFDGEGTVFYGADDRWVSRTVTGVTECTNRVFGDPAPGVRKTCYVELHASLRWVRWNGTMPAGAVVGGQEANGQTIYVCRANHMGGVHPGKTAGGRCNIGWGGGEEALPQFDVLTGTGRWGPLAAGAFAGGNETGGKPLLVCRGQHNGGQHSGKLVSNRCNIGWGGTEVALAEYQVLFASAPAPAPAPVPTPVPSPAAPVPDSAPPVKSDVAEICWRRSVLRGDGEPASECADGLEMIGGDTRCYPKCVDGFKGFRSTCWETCPAGFEDYGEICSKPKPYKRGDAFGFFAFIEDIDGARLRCERVHGQGRCQRSGAFYYPRCKPGFVASGSSCAAVCPANMEDGGSYCKKRNYSRGEGEGRICAAGMEQGSRGGLCYPKCEGDASGIGPRCWSACGGAYPVNCGTACGATEAACAAVVLQQAPESAELAINLAALSRGAVNPSLKAALPSGTPARRTVDAARRQTLKQQARERIGQTLRAAREQVSSGRGGDLLDAPENRDRLAELLVLTYERGEFDFTALAPVGAKQEASGFVALLQAFNRPFCR
jgi:hypothetical protein